MLATFLAALAIEAEALAVMGLSDTALGALLLALNLSVVFLSLFWCARRLSADRERRQWRQALTPRQARLLFDIMGDTHDTCAQLDAVDDEFGGGSSSMDAGVDVDVDMDSSGDGGDGSLGGGSDVVDLGGDGKSVQMVRLPPPKQKRTKQKQKQKVQQQKQALAQSTPHVATLTQRLQQHAVRARDVVMIRKVGQGSFGEVFKATCLGEPVAVKVLLEITEETVVGFRSEILLTASLRHPNIVSFKGACE